ncbi:aminotransferase class I/II-fold pyridoxal phosphate-dependent enzyme [Affinirhizobium pseudoryzae]|uniref:aminotransferase class I/II-fold pyridoxal phosphate-dependent enzyme n=1 Tax=Allorhizobium pseudoryzae TaxID=379684 RepID=UPI0013EA3544|nr:aminotransferase class I/II-fold pyridoxal phosphate-dependent enzyme [Allorhizobium pseudoryzae]
MINASDRQFHEQSLQSFRNTGTMIDVAGTSFDAAHFRGIMALYAAPGVGRSVRLAHNGQDAIDFVRCSYLGLDNHPAIVEGAAKAVLDDGTLHWSCARTRLNFRRLGDVEDKLSDLFGARALTFTTVLAANMSALPLIASGHLTGGQRPVMVFDRLAHATLAHHKGVVAQETRVETIAHNDLARLKEICRDNARVAYVCDGIYSMGGQAPIAALRDLQNRYGLFLYIDDAHGVSLFGPQGEGYARSQINDIGDRTIIASSLGKGFGASGGVLLLGSAGQELLFRRFAIAHAFSASLNTAALGAVAASANIHRSPELALRQNRLAANVALLDELIPSDFAGQPFPIRMFPIGDELLTINTARELLQRGFYVSAVFFPTVARGKAGLRVCLTADHTEEQLRGLAGAFADINAGLIGTDPSI